MEKPKLIEVISELITELKSINDYNIANTWHSKANTYLENIQDCQLRRDFNKLIFYEYVYKTVYSRNSDKSYQEKDGVIFSYPRKQQANELLLSIQKLLNDGGIKMIGHQKETTENRERNVVLDKWWEFFKTEDKNGVTPLSTNIHLLCKKLNIDYHLDSGEYEQEFINRYILEKKPIGLIKGREFYSFKGFVNEQLDKDKPAMPYTQTINTIHNHAPSYGNQLAGSLEGGTQEINQQTIAVAKQENNKSLLLKVWLNISENKLISMVIGTFILFIVGSFVKYHYPQFPCWECK